MFLLPVVKAIGERWITIHPHGKGAVGKYGDKDYRRILIDESGKIVGGSIPKSAHGLSLHDAFRKEKKATPFLSQHLTAHNAKHEITETENGHHYKLGNGVQYGKDKWGRDTVARGSVHFQKFARPSGWDGQWVRLDSNFFDKDELKNMGARFSGDTKKWYIPHKDVPNVAKHFKHAEIDPSVSAAYEKLLSQQPPQEKKQVEINTQKGPVQFEAKEPPAWNGDMPEDMKHVNLYQHQKAGVEFLLKHKKAILGMAVGLGKCVAGDTPIMLSDGIVKSISEVIDPIIGDLKVNETEKEVQVTNLKVPALNVETGKVSWQTVESVFKQRIKDDLYRIKTKRGKSISLTSDHPLPIVRDGKIVWTRCVDVRVGDTLATPQSIDAIHVDNGLSIEHAQLLAWQLSEGYEDAKRNAANITNKDENVLSFVQKMALEITPHVHLRRPAKRCPDVEINGIIYRQWLESYGFPYGAKSADRYVPSVIWGAGKETVRSFLRVLFDAEGTVSQDIQIEFCSASQRLVTEVAYLLLRFGIVGQYKSVEKMATNGMRIKRTYWRLFISSEDMRTFQREIGFENIKKSERLEKSCSKKCNPNLNVVPFANILNRVADSCGLSINVLLGKSIGRSSVNMQSFSRESMKKISEIARGLYDGTRVKQEEEFLEELNATSHRSGFSRSKRQVDKIRNITGSEVCKELYQCADVLSSEDIAWDEIRQIEFMPGVHLVYDFKVSNDHSFVGGHGGGLFLHNTPSSITAANVALDKGEVKRFAVIAPSSVKYQWKSEIEKFSGRKAVVIDTSSKKKLEQSLEQAKDADYVIANYEMLRNSDYATALKELAGDAVIADEGHKVKNTGSQQTKAFQDTFKDAKYKWLLTATPFPNGQPKETHTMLHHANPKKAGTWSEFAKNHAVMQKVHTARGDVMKPVALKHQDKLRENMKDVVFLRHHGSSDVNSSLPSARHIAHNIEMSKDQEKQYRNMALGIRDELNGMNEEQFKQNAANILTKMKRLEQIALDPDQLDPEHADMNKLYPKEEWAVQTTIDHLEDADNRGMVIFSDMKLPLEKVKHGLIKEGVQPSEIGVISGDVTPEKRKQVADLFGQGKIKVVLSTSAGEEGVNLQHGGHTMIHLDTPWVPKSITQREGRVLRTGQKSGHTVFYSPTMSGTIEEQKRGKLAAKVGEIEKLLGEGSAGSASENIKADAKTWTLKDMKELLGDLPDAKVVKKSMRTKDEWKDVKQRKQSEYGQGEYFADPAHNSYPLTKGGKPSKERVLAAWRYLHTKRDKGEYSESEYNRVASRIRGFAKNHFDMELESKEETKKSFIFALPIQD